MTRHFNQSSDKLSGAIETVNDLKQEEPFLPRGHVQCTFFHFVRIAFIFKVTVCNF